ncbi:MAG: hypothetical protein K9I71_10285 [Ignavibacteriales bacterium]|nr:hypothetical protein [Ignavibacteriales bacterium]MCF8437427.1 hypothetical protein [Ignavibacteriales bacterium]
MNDDKLIELFKETAAKVSLLDIDESEIKKLHHERSKHFVELLAEGFRNHYSNNSNIKIFTKHFNGNRKEFGINEYLYDVLVCEVDSVISAKQQKKLPFITEAIWLVESEFARNTREALKDFNKLVIGNSKYKLFIGPLNSVNDTFISALLPAAKKCNGIVYIILFSHPDSWDKGSRIDFSIWKLNERWQMIYSCV